MFDRPGNGGRRREAPPGREGFPAPRDRCARRRARHEDPRRPRLLLGQRFLSGRGGPRSIAACAPSPSRSATRTSRSSSSITAVGACSADVVRAHPGARVEQDIRCRAWRRSGDENAPALHHGRGRLDRAVALVQLHAAATASFEIWIVPGQATARRSSATNISFAPARFLRSHAPRAEYHALNARADRHDRLRRRHSALLRPREGAHGARARRPLHGARSLHPGRSRPGHRVSQVRAAVVPGRDGPDLHAGARALEPPRAAPDRDGRHRRTRASRRSPSSSRWPPGPTS